MPSRSIGFIGAGQMATALARGLVQAGLAKSDEIVAYDPVPQAIASFVAATGGKSVEDSQKVADAASIVFLAVKPQHMSHALDELRGSVGSKHLVISIAAGVTLARMAKGLAASQGGNGARLVRVMPNTPCLIGESASGFCMGPGTTPDDRQTVEQLLSAVGRSFALDEPLLDAVTGLSGSGPAFVYLMIEALSDGGVRMGLPRAVATSLAAQTVLGAAKMVLETGEHPAVLKDRVASPGGTTIAGLQALEDRGVRGALMAAVESATRRSIELGTK